MIRYLGKVTCAEYDRIADAIGCKPQAAAFYLNKLKQRYLVRNVTWHNGRRVWLLTEEGARRLEYYQRKEQE